MKIVSTLALIILSGYIAGAGLLYAFQRDFLYFPTEKYEHPFERMNVSSQGESIEVIILNKGNSKALIYFGGNGEAVVANAEKFSSRLRDVTIYLVNYRGYGGSSGVPTEQGIYADALNVYDEIKGAYAQISVAGRSLGSGVATYMAANRPVESVVLITPYDSVLRIAESKFAIFPVRFLLKDHFDSVSRAKNIDAKVLVVVAARDQVIPMSHTQKLINEFGSSQVTVRIVESAGHNSLSNSREYYEALSDFM